MWNYFKKGFFCKTRYIKAKALVKIDWLKLLEKISINLKYSILSDCSKTDAINLIFWMDLINREYGKMFKKYYKDSKELTEALQRVKAVYEL